MFVVRKTPNNDFSDTENPPMRLSPESENGDPFHLEEIYVKEEKLNEVKRWHRYVLKSNIIPKTKGWLQGKNPETTAMTDGNTDTSDLLLASSIRDIDFDAKWEDGTRKYDQWLSDYYDACAKQNVRSRVWKKVAGKFWGYENKWKQVDCPRGDLKIVCAYMIAENDTQQILLTPGVDFVAWCVDNDPDTIHLATTGTTDTTTPVMQNQAWHAISDNGKYYVTQAPSGLTGVVQ